MIRKCNGMHEGIFKGESRIKKGLVLKRSKNFPFVRPPPSALRPRTIKKLPLTLPLSDLQPVDMQVKFFLI